jgi:steroid delta-isomerase-like uncharacterized protein
MLKTSPFKSSSADPRAQANHALWLQHARAENRRQLEEIVATLHEDCEYVLYPSGKSWKGKEGAREFYRGLWAAIPDVKLNLLHRIDADTAVVEESEVYGTLDGSLFGVLPPTHQPIRFRLVIIFPVRDGLFTGERLYLDSGELLKQIPGAVWHF